MLNTIPLQADDEIFKFINGYENKYAISNYGNVYSFKRNQFMAPSIYSDTRINNSKSTSYYRIKLRSPGTNGKLFPIHRLVATHFIDNIDNKATVNHKDGNGLNNHISNLEWMTVKENIQHAIQNGWHCSVDLSTQKQFLKQGNMTRSKDRRAYRLSLIGKSFGGATLISIEFMDDTSVKIANAVLQCNHCKSNRNITNNTFQTYIIDRKEIGYCHSCAAKKNMI